MSKYELDGYVPLRPWQRTVSYFAFITVGVLAYLRLQPGMPAAVTLLFIGALVVAASCALVSLWDARVTARLRRKGAKKVRVVAGFAQPPLTFFEREGSWEYFSDSAPTTTRA